MTDRVSGAARAPYAAFGAFGTFWGAWGAALPSLRTSAGVSAGELGTVLLCVGAGAVPAIALAGRAVERWGLRVGAVMLSLLALSGLVVTALAHGVVLLVLAVLLVGASSGATDVSINTLAGRAEAVSSGPVISRSHGLFSVGVVLSSLATGAVLGAGVPLVATFALVAVVMAALAFAAARWSSGLAVAPAGATGADATGAEGSGATVGEPDPRPAPPAALLLAPLLAVGTVAALAFAIENAHQSWGALMLTDVFGARPQLAAVAPAAFAATAAVARLGLAPLTRSHPDLVLLGGGGLATVGSALLATAPSVVVALVGLVLAALGTATLFPTCSAGACGAWIRRARPAPPPGCPPPPTSASWWGPPSSGCWPATPGCGWRSVRWRRWRRS